MKAAVYYETGAPEVFRYEDVPDPVVGPGDVLIDVEAISIEGGDTLNRLGGDLASVPHVVGYQCAGTVAEVGADVRGFAVGDRAVTVGLDGSHAERRATPESFAWKIPDGVPTDEAACVPVPVRDRRRLPLRVRPSAERARPRSSMPAPVGWVSRRSRWRSGPAHGSSPRRRARIGSSG